MMLAWCLLVPASAATTETTTGTNATTQVTVGAGTGGDVVTTVVKTKRRALSFGLDRIPGLQNRLLDIPLWEYLASAIYVVIAFIAARIFDYLLTVQLRRLTRHTKTELDDMLVNLLHGPAKVLALVFMLQFGLNLFNWPPWLEAWLKKGFYLLLAISFTYMTLKLVDVAAMYWRSRPAVKSDKTFNDLLVPMVSKSLKVFILIMAVLATLDNLGFNIRTLLAGVSISGLALGLAAQDTVGNLFGAAAVFVDKPFKIGEFVKLEGVEGSVEEIGLRSTRLRNPDGHLITVPNKTMGNATITNVTRRTNIKTVMNLGLTYETTAEQMKRAFQILTEVYKSSPNTHDLIIGFNSFADSSLNFQVIHWWKGTDYKKYVLGFQELNLQVKTRFDAEGINFAFPSRTIYLKQDSEWKVLAPDHSLEAKNPAPLAQDQKAG